MNSKVHLLTAPSLKRPILYSVIIHLVVFITLSVIPGITLSLRESHTRIVWVELPKGISEEVGLGIKKSTSLPQSTIEEQKKFVSPEQKTLSPEMKTPKQTSEKPTEPTPKMTEPSKSKATEKTTPKKPVSVIDKKIANALAKIDKQLAQRAVAPEAAQINESGEGYKYGTGTQPLKVLPSDPEYLKYQALVRARIIQEWVIPLRYVEEGQVRRHCAVNVMVNTDGEVVSTSWESQSGDATFDASALRAVRKASPFPKPPDRLAWEVYNEGFLVEFDPRLKPQ